MSDISEKHLEKAREALKIGDIDMPPEFFPNECYFPGSTDPWDIWESEKYVKNLPHCIMHWNKCLAKARRELKLEKKRKINYCYCKKSDYNYEKFLFLKKK